MSADAIISPPDDATIWRYLNLAKFVHMLESNTLWFTRADQFEDPFEAGYTDAELKQIKSEAGSRRSYLTFPPHEELTRKTRMSTYLNCWRKGSGESLAMWDLYGSGVGSVAIKTTAGKLRKSVEYSAENLLLAEVSYVDWDDLGYVMDGVSLCTRKELSYQHEAEIRLIMMASINEAFAAVGTDPPNIPSFRDSYLFIESAMPLGRGLKLSLTELIAEVIVGPREPAWIADLIRKLMVRYGLDRPIRLSDRLKLRQLP